MTSPNVCSGIPDDLDKQPLCWNKKKAHIFLDVLQNPLKKQRGHFITLKHFSKYDVHFVRVRVTRRMCESP